jgi:AcrR family transcriptional regulator
MVTETGETSPATTRRERQRQATYAEIVSVARQTLREHDSISLRAIATEMGMTPPALYRYVDGYDELIGLVANAIFDDMLVAMSQASGRYDSDDYGAQVVAAAVAFRQWSLRHPEEFGLIFANRATSKAKAITKHQIEGGQRFAEFFSHIYQEIWRRYEFALPAPEDLPAGAAGDLEQARDHGLLPCDFEDAPIGLTWVFLRAWARLYGTVTLEVFGHLDDAMIASGAVFRAMLEDNGSELNLGADWPRLRAIIDTELSRPAR